VFKAKGGQRLNRGSINPIENAKRAASHGKAAAARWARQSGDADII
jgi:hypothetical protein